WADPTRPPAFGHRWTLEVRRRRSLRDLAPVEVGSRHSMVRADQRQEMAAEQLALLVLHDTRRRRVHVGEMSVGVAVVDQILRVLDDVAEPLLARAQRFFRAPAI